MSSLSLVVLNQRALCNIICRRTSFTFKFLLMVLNLAWDIHVDVNIVLTLLGVSRNALVLLLLRYFINFYQLLGRIRSWTSLILV